MTRSGPERLEESNATLPPAHKGRALRVARSVTREQLATAVGVTTATVRSWETGRTSPRGRKRSAYARILARLEAGLPLEEPTGDARNTGDVGGAVDVGGARDTGRDGTPPSPPTPAAGASAATHAVQRLLIEAFTAPPGTGAASALPANGEQPEPPGPSPMGIQTEPGRASDETDRRAASRSPSHDPSPSHAEAGPPPGKTGSASAPAPDPSGTRSGPPRRKEPRRPPSWTRKQPTGPAADEMAPAPALTLTGTPTGPPRERKRGHVPSWARAQERDPAAGRTRERRADDNRAADRSRTRQAKPRTPRPTDEPAAAAAARVTPADAFDALYERHAAPLARQTYLLTGRPQLGRRAVERAFQLAWEQWPAVAVDRDPAGWVRAAAYEHALSPWHRLRPGGDEPPAEPERERDAALLRAMVSLPGSYRRTLLLHDGVGLGLPETAAETEATTPAAANRLRHARSAVAERLPELRDLAPADQGTALGERFSALAATLPGTVTAARLVRADGERLTRRSTRAAFGITAVIAVATAFTLLTSEGPVPPRPRQVQPAATAPATQQPATGKARKAAERQADAELRGLPRSGRLVPDSR
ncbi:helix-turn-helix domain-containing protein [Streptomyces sp. NPDC050610]|uniref:helix-turn-helix domain-containing protein n=1 Tax=Streptomyces sp. NPDC050610 TaxID=3157097 RepID=UPI00341EEE24